jgi:hypothetical protein
VSLYRNGTKYLNGLDCQLKAYAGVFTPSFVSNEVPHSYLLSCCLDEKSHENMNNICSIHWLSSGLRTQPFKCHVFVKEREFDTYVWFTLVQDNREKQYTKGIKEVLQS